MFPVQWLQGDYELVIGPNILDVAGLAMDQNGDGLHGQGPEDQYTAVWSIKAVSSVVGHEPSDEVDDLVSRVVFSFRGAMAPESFTVADDVVSFTGPERPHCRQRVGCGMPPRRR